VRPTKEGALRILKHSIFTAALLIGVGTGAAYALTHGGLRAAGDPAVEVLEQGWKRHVYRPWLEARGWFVEADEPDVKGFQYHASVRNNLSKTVRAVEWEYLFLKPSDGSVAARHSSRTEAKIKPGKVRELTGFTVEPPTYMIEAGAADSRPGLLEHVNVRAVVFEDGTRQTF
jgi:hypothetical protein